MEATFRYIFNIREADGHGTMTTCVCDLCGAVVLMAFWSQHYDWHAKNDVVEQ